MNPRVINTIRFVSALLSVLVMLAGIPLMAADYITPILSINPTLAHWWPAFFAGANIISQAGKMLMSYLARFITPATAAALCVGLTACLSTNTGNVKKDRFNGVANIVLTDMAKAIGQAGVQALYATVSSEKPSSQAFLDAAASDLWKQAPLVVNSDKVTQIINAATLTHTPETAAVAAAVYEAANPQTPEQRVAVVNGIAATISSTRAGTNPVP